MTERKVVLSLVRATGRLHLGNYLGAARDFAELSRDETKECYFGVADLHALTTLPDPQELAASSRAVARDYLAAGIDPERAALFLQSAVPETAELFWLLSNVTAAGELQRSKTFKEMSAKQPDNVNAGLLNYPILMAADILGPEADLVPVGEDQMAHLEMARNIAQRFNHHYGELLKTPAGYRKKAIRIPGLDGKGKMSKSDGNGFGIADSPEDIWKALGEIDIALLPKTFGRCCSRPTRTRPASGARTPAIPRSAPSARSTASCRRPRTWRRSRRAAARRASGAWTARRSSWET